MLKLTMQQTEISGIDQKQQMQYATIKILFAFVFLTKYRRCSAGGFNGHFLFEIKNPLFAVLSMFVETMFHLFQLLTASGNIFQSKSDANETALK